MLYPPETLPGTSVLLFWRDTKLLIFKYKKLDKNCSCHSNFFNNPLLINSILELQLVNTQKYSNKHKIYNNVLPYVGYI